VKLVKGTARVVRGGGLAVASIAVGLLAGCGPADSGPVETVVSISSGITSVARPSSTSAKILAEIAERCPCDAQWANHGQYVSCVARAVNDLRRRGLLGAGEGAGIVSRAARNQLCGLPQSCGLPSAFIPTMPMAGPRTQHTATLLPDGRVLVVGGSDGTTELATAEIYDLNTESFTAIGPLNIARQRHTATALPDGRVLIVGGINSTNGHTYLSSAEIFDPATLTFSPTGDLLTKRDLHTATALADGQVMVVGGYAEFSPRDTLYDRYLHTSEVYDPIAGQWQAAGPLPLGRNRHAAVRLLSGDVMVIGGHGPLPTGGEGELASAEMFGAAPETFSAAQSMSGARRRITANLLASGSVLVTGGSFTITSSPPDTLYFARTELYDPVSGGFLPGPDMTTSRDGHQALNLTDGTVLVVGGSNPNQQDSGEIYDPTANTFQSVGTMIEPRDGHTATRMRNNIVLVTGGYNPQGTLSSAELYAPCDYRP
jgi:hypothetical protein